MIIFKCSEQNGDIDRILFNGQNRLNVWYKSIR